MIVNRSETISAIKACLRFLEISYSCNHASVISHCREVVEKKRYKLESSNFFLNSVLSIFWFVDIFLSFFVSSVFFSTIQGQEFMKIFSVGDL